LERKDGFLHGSKGVVSRVIQFSLGILNRHKEIDSLRHTDIDVVLLKKLNRVAKLGEALNCLVLDLSDISQVGHDLGQELLVALVGKLLIFGEHLDAIRNILDEGLDVL